MTLEADTIVDVEATPAFRTDEVNATRTMIDRVEERFERKPTRLIGDMAYGVAKLLDWIVNEKAIEPHVPVWDKTQRKDETLSSSDFQWDELADEYRYRVYCLGPLSNDSILDVGALSSCLSTAGCQ